MVALGTALVDAGHEVRMLGSPNGKAFAEEHGLRFDPLGLDIHDWFRNHAEFVQDRPLATFLSMSQEVNAQVRLHVQEMKRHGEWADIFVGGGVLHAAASVAEAFGKPYRYIAYCAQIVPSRLHAPYVVPFQRLPGWANLLSWQLMDLVLLAGAAPALNRVRRELLDLDPVWRITNQVTPRGSVILAVNPDLAPTPYDHDPDLRVTGFLHLPQSGPLPDDVDAFIEAGSPPVYIGFGSTTDHRAEQTTDLLVQAVEQAGARALIAHGWAGLAQGSLPSSCLAVGPLPHAVLFPRLSGVIHHGSSGTTATAALAGRPQLIVPHLLDQFYWGKHVQRVGLGPRPIRRRLLNSKNLSAAIRQLVDDDAMKTRARIFGERMQQRDGRAEAVKALEEAVYGRPFVRPIEAKREAALSPPSPAEIAARLAELPLRGSQPDTISLGD